MVTVKKIHTGELFTDSDGKNYYWLGSDKWTTWNDNGHMLEVYNLKYIAQYEADLLNGIKEPIVTVKFRR